MCNHLLNKLFDDRRMIVCCLLVWLGVVLLGFSHLGLLDTTYTTMGPSDHTVFMSVVLNTWKRWGFVAMYTVVSAMISDFSGDSLGPFFTNIIMDHKTKYIPYPKSTCILICQAYTIYATLMSVIGLHLMLSQIDFVLIRLLTDLCVNVWTQSRLLRHKEFNPTKYHEVEMHLVPNSDKEDVDSYSPEEKA